MKPQVKKIIAREGLLVIILFTLGFIVMMLIGPTTGVVEKMIREYETEHNLARQPGFDERKGVATEVIVDTLAPNKNHYENFDENDVYWKHIGHLRSLMNVKAGLSRVLWLLLIFFWFVSYPLCWLIRFIIWALKTLRDSKMESTP